MRLPKPSAPFSPVCVVGDSITLDTTGKVLVLPTENADVLPLFNEYVLSSARLTDNFGGLTGAGSPDYSVGTVYTPTDGVYLTDTSGTNSTKTLTGGKLKELELLTVDTTAHTITEKFIVANTAESNNPTVLDACSDPASWTVQYATETSKSSNGSSITISGTSDSNGWILANKTIADLNIDSKQFATLTITPTVSGWVYFAIGSAGARCVRWAEKNGFTVTANQTYTFLFPFKAPKSTAYDSNPNKISGTPVFNNGIYILLGITTTADTVGSFTFSNLNTDTGKPAYIELATPDNIQNVTTQCWTGSAYETVRIDSLNGAYSNISGDTTKLKMLDGTLFNDVYGTGLGRAVFPKGTAEETKAGSTGSITYSANQGTKNRIGLRVDLPPSDGGRTNFNKIRLKTILTYAPDVDDNYSASYDFADSTNTSYGLQNLAKPWIALYDPITSEVDFYLFTHRPKNLEYKKDESGTIYEVTLYPGNGSIYWGRVHYSDLTVDSDSDDIPNCLDSSLEGSITKFLQSYGMVI